MSRGAGAPALAVSGEETHHSGFLLRARHAAVVVVGVGPTDRRCSDERPFYFGARSWCDVPTEASNAKPAPRATRRRRAGARCLWGGGAALELAARARRTALVVVGLVSKKGAASARGLSPSTCGCGATCQLRPQRQASAACRTAQARRRSLSLGRRRSTQACCARAPCCAGCARHSR